jgi:peptide/nickel transport system ATP-binding protein
MSSEPLLTVQDLKTYFDTEDGSVRAVDGVSFDVNRGETVALVGESGSGKTVTSESITKILQMPPGRIAGGSVQFDGRDLTAMSDEELREFRGNRISHIFQNPQNGLNPVYTVGRQISEAIRIHHEDVSKKEAREEAVDLLDRTGIPEASARIDDYPHEFSGGMKQRVLIAMALANNPDLLIADEPTTALDVTIQAQILRLLNDLQEEFDMSVIFITHDLAVVSQIADRVVVMYSGKVMETGTIEEVFDDPAHPYTHALMNCLPGRSGKMRRIEGRIPDPTDPPDGCRFHPRCPHAVAECKEGEQPPMHGVEGARTHEASCVYHGPGFDAAELESREEGDMSDESDVWADGGEQR